MAAGLKRWRWGHGIAAACLAACGSSAWSAPTIESLPLAAAYGSGVHSYYAGDYQRAYDELSQAIEGGTADPRAWYYRGLSALKLGRTDESEADFSAGARRESEGTGAWPVARSLERVQGCDRLKLERHRTRARVAQIQEDRRRTQLRYLDVERGDVLRERRPVMERRVDDVNPLGVDAAGREPPRPGWAPKEEIPAPAGDGAAADRAADGEMPSEDPAAGTDGGRIEAEAP